MPVLNTDADGGIVTTKIKKQDIEEDDDVEGKQDDCSDLTDNNHETDESTSKSFPQKVSLVPTIFAKFKMYEKCHLPSRALSLRPSSDCACDKTFTPPQQNRFPLACVKNK